MSAKSDVLAQVKVGLIVLAAVVAFVALARLIPSSDQSDLTDSTFDPAYTAIDWKILRGLDWKTGQADDVLKNLSGKKVRIPGFIVPLEDELSKISEFLLVPSPQACIHVPPPPPNQMIYVKLKKPLPFSWSMRAYWILGTISLKSMDSPYGKISFELEGDEFKPFSQLNL